MPNSQESQEPAAIDLAAVERFWSEYITAHPEHENAPRTAEQFGDSAELSDELLGLIISGKKRATCDRLAAYHEESIAVPNPGDHLIACDSFGNPRLILEDREVWIAPFTSADADFAAAEGEGDGSFEYWYSGHRRYFERNDPQWSVHDDIVFERFAVRWPAELADG